MKKALITGATRGIGKAILEKFIDEGIYVIGTYAGSEDVANDLVGIHGADKVTFKQFTLGDKKSHTNLLDDLPSDISILVNNAGVGSKSVERYASTKEEQDISLFQINAIGTLWLTEEIIQRMTNASGKIINISSVGGGIFHYPGFRLADGMSKAALTFMTRQMAAEQSHSNIDIFAICPGATETDMFEASTLAQLNSEDRKKFIETLPKKRLINPREIADLCFYLTQPSSQILHGAIIDSSLGLGTNPGALK